MSEGAVTRMLALLKQERDALKKGDFAMLDRSIEEKQRLFDVLRRSSSPEKYLREVHNALVENQALISAAMSGVKSAQKRLKMLDEMRHGMTVYNRAGGMAIVANPQSSIEKKA
ncbi:hypothetical protein [Yoonia sp. SS1-5]|uniref:FlgN protein n=1 Tax=Yoonia rhodophyticola TaxID=3137370 RepID=A0AAN0MKY7_9RHOB